MSEPPKRMREGDPMTGCLWILIAFLSLCLIIALAMRAPA